MGNSDWFGAVDKGPTFGIENDAQDKLSPPKGPAPRLLDPTAQRAQVWPAPSPLGTPVLGFRGTWKGALLSNCGGLLLIALVGGSLAAVAIVRGKELTEEEFIKEFILWVGLLLIPCLGTAWFELRSYNLFAHRVLWRRVRVELTGRPDALVRPEDDGAVFVDVVARRDWRRLMLNNSADVGLLRVDVEAGCLFFEGVNERWCIPASSIVSCETETVKFGNSPVNHFLTIINAWGGDTHYERSLFGIPLTWKGAAKRRRKEAAEVLRRKILDLLPAERRSALIHTVSLGR